MYQHFAVDAGDIVMASSGNSYGKIAVVRQQDLPLVMNTSVIRFKANKATIVDPFVKTVNEVFLRCENVLVFLSFSFSL